MHPSDLNRRNAFGTTIATTVLLLALGACSTDSGHRAALIACVSAQQVKGAWGVLSHDDLIALADRAANNAAMASDEDSKYSQLSTLSDGLADSVVAADAANSQALWAAVMGECVDLGLLDG